MKKILVVFIFALLFVSSCMILKKHKEVDSNIILLSTNYGDIKLKLYDETPLHRDNFKKLVKEEYYDSLLFHRIIPKFMIQGGDPDSKNAKKEQILGNGGPGYTIPAELNTKFIHKKGALAAARKGDRENPKKKSSGSQFYIVEGKTWSDKDLDQFEDRITMTNMNEKIREYLNKPENKELKDNLTMLQRKRDMTKLESISKEIENIIMSENKDSISYKFTEEQREAYKTIGGTPHLDGAYTVFGEVIEGLSILDSLSNVKTDKNNRPLEDIRIIKMKMVKD